MAANCCNVTYFVSLAISKFPLVKFEITSNGNSLISCTWTPPCGEKSMH